MDEQLSLFADLYKSDAERFADRLCEEFNKIPTVWQGTFYVYRVELENWDEVKDRVLTVQINSTINTMDSRDNHFTYLKGDEQSQENLDTFREFSPYLDQLKQDKDFAVCITPWTIFVYYHKFERKKI